jgi:hypothetical protein
VNILLNPNVQEKELTEKAPVKAVMINKFPEKERGILTGAEFLTSPWLPLQ